jgi:hypothetical protein
MAERNRKGGNLTYRVEFGLVLRTTGDIRMPNEAHARPKQGNSVVIVRESAPQLILPYAYETHILPFNLSEDGLSRSIYSGRSIRLFKSPSLRNKQLPLSADPWLWAQPHSPKSYVIAQPRRRADELQSNRHRLLGKSTPYAELEDTISAPPTPLTFLLNLPGRPPDSSGPFPCRILPRTPSHHSILSIPVPRKSLPALPQ